ncbi:MAG: hypothetical protein LBH74_08210 [Nitrososphaerota archaeon]|nr:hypothetical protein [Nitrososphaerota archaeon]
MLVNYFTYTYTSRAGRMARGISLWCSKCGKEIKVNTPAVSVRMRWQQKIYHQECYEICYIDIYAQ